MNDNYVYLISNIHRSGSSMMMRCFEAGGMNVAYDGHDESLNTEFNTPGYVPNPNGFYGLEEDFTRPDFFELYKGKVLKLPYRHLLGLPTGQYRLVFMRRNPEEIRASMQAFMPDVAWGADALFLEFYDEVVDALLARLRARGDFEVVVLEYEDVVRDPSAAFQTLFDAGWELDVALSASMVDPSLHRFKLENK